MQLHCLILLTNMTLLFIIEDKASIIQYKIIECI